mmetsp:Transcript_71159/g.212210  ORF Transcript_71159/g.212210 Transcript_71159/m.212210 type:complete len:237 (+) Transcript_71159:684-1394(+)
MHHGERSRAEVAQGVHGLPETSGEALEGGLDDVVRVVAPHLRQQQPAAERLRDVVEEDLGEGRSEGANIRAPAWGVDAVGGQGNLCIPGNASVSTRGELQRQVGEGLVQGRREGPAACATGGPGPRGQQRLQRPAQGGAGQPCEHGIGTELLQLVGVRLCRPPGHRRAHGHPQLCVRCHLVHHVVQVRNAARNDRRSADRRRSRVRGIGDGGGDPQQPKLRHGLLGLRTARAPSRP